MKRYMMFGVGVITLAVFIAIVVVLIKPDKKEVIDVSMLSEMSSTLEEPTSDVTFDAINMSALLVCISQSELDQLVLQIEKIFVEYLPSVIMSGLDEAFYYDNYSEEIHRKLGITSETEFMNVYNKCVKKADFEECQVTLVTESLKVEDEGYFFDLDILYDDMLQITYHVFLDRNDLSMTIR